MMEIAKMTNAPCPLRAIQSVTPRRVSAALTIVLEVCAYYIFDLVEKWRFSPERAIALWGATEKFTYTNWKNGEPAKLTLSFDLGFDLARMSYLLRIFRAL